jgi:hypothetical protein
MNKKASLQDIGMAAIIVVVVGIMILFGAKFMTELNTKVQANNVITTDGKIASSTLTAHYSGAIDNSFLLLAIGLSMGALILAALVRVHPIFIPIYILLLIFLIFVCGIFSNIYQEMAATSEMTATADTLTFVTNILTYLPLIVGVIGSLLAIIMYKGYKDAAY